MNPQGAPKMLERETMYGCILVCERLCQKLQSIFKRYLALDPDVICLEIYDLLTKRRKGARRDRGREGGRGEREEGQQNGG